MAEQEKHYYDVFGAAWKAHGCACGHSSSVHGTDGECYSYCTCKIFATDNLEWLRLNRAKV